LEATQRWGKNNPEKARAGAQRRQAWRAPRDEYYERTKAERQKRSREWYEANKERRNEQIRIWQKRNPEILRAVKHNYRNKLSNGGKHSAADIKALMKTQKGKCAHPWCRRSLSEGYHVDHRMPVARGGKNDRRNIQLLCPTCNLRKSDKHPEAFAQENGFLV
jgi:5-methylcytosine-specific restriction endonuclease McrA